MQRIKRWTLGIFSGVDRIVGQIENQEAVVDAILRDVRRGTAKAKVRLGCVQRDGRVLRDRQATARAEAERWGDRARRTVEGDEKKALECLRRRRRAAAEAEELARRLEEHSRVEATLRREIGTLEGRCRELAERRNLMRTRSSRAEALRLARSLEAGGIGELDDVFERWEVRVAEAEIEGGLDDPATSVDPFAEQWSDEEEDESLRAELEALRAEPMPVGSAAEESGEEADDVAR